MKKILHCLSSLKFGGTELAIYNYLSSMDRTGLDIHILVLYNEEDTMAQEFLALGCTIHHLKSKANSFFARPKEFKDFLLNEKFDVVHVNSMSASKYRYAKIAKQAGVKKVIYHSHGAFMSGPYKILHNLSKSKVDKWTDLRFACSEMAGKFMYNASFTVLNNAINVQKFAFDQTARNELREKYQCQDKIVVGCVGRLTPIKNHTFLIKVAKKYCDLGHKDIVFVCCGAGELKSQLETQVTQLGLENNFIFTGLIKDVHLYYNMFDVTAFPSIKEGFGLVMVESQANGCRTIGSIGIPSEAIMSDLAIRLPIDETDENYQHWAEKIIEFAHLERSSAIEQIRQNGFDIEVEAEKLRKVYLSD